MQQLELVHEELMAEESLKLTDLPQDIQRKVKGFDLLHARWKKQPEESKEEKLTTSLNVQSIGIADLIQTWLEKDSEEEDTPPATPKGDAPPTPPATPPKGDEPPTPPATPPAGGFGTALMKKKILDIIAADPAKRISRGALEEIIGKPVDKNGNGPQKVLDITLVKIFGIGYYRLG